MIFIDTGAFLARYLANDQYHARALHYWKEIQKHKTPCYTSNFVLNEFITLMSRRISYKLAAKLNKDLMESSLLVILRPQEDDELIALKQFLKFADQKVSFTDCLSYALMKKNHITHIFSFDRHFALWNFHCYPK